MCAGGETACPAQLVIDNDIWATLRRIARGMQVDAETKRRVDRTIAEFERGRA